MSLRILHVFRPSDSDFGRSVEDICGLCDVQRQFGHAVEILTLGIPAPKRFERLEVRMHQVASRLGGYAYSPELVRWLGANATNYHCVIVHGIWDFGGIGAWWALRKAGIPYFIFPHGKLDPWFKNRHPFRHMFRWLYWPWAGYPVFRDAHAVFFLCEEERQRASQPFWLYDCHEFVVRPGLEGLPPGEVDPGSGHFLERHPSLRGKRLFTVVTGDNPLEGVGNLIEAVDILSQKGVWDLKAMTLVVVDSTSPPARSYLERLAIKRGVSGSIEILSSGSERDTWGALQACEAAVRTSPFEVSLREVVKALSCGKPVLASKGVLYWKEIVNEGAGMAADPTAEGYARMLGAWLRLGGDERSAMSLNARRCYEARFSHIGGAHSLTSAIYLLVGIHRDNRWDSRPLRPASESM